MQLCDGDVSVLDTMKNRRLGPAEVKEKFGVAPEQVGDVLALMGDSVDNVPGVDGIGPKTASELINKFGSLDALLAGAGEVKGKRGEALVDARASIRISRELVRLRDDVPLPKTLAELHRVEPDRSGWAALSRAGVLAPRRAADGVRPGATRPSAAKSSGGSPAAAPPPVAPAPVRGAARCPSTPSSTGRRCGARGGDRRGGRGRPRRARRRVSAVRADLVGLRLRAAGRAAAPTCRSATATWGRRPACPRRALGAPAPLLASPAVAQARARRQDAGGAAAPARRGARRRGVGLDDGVVPARRLAHALRPRRGRGHARRWATRPRARSWMGTGRNAHPGADIPVEEVGPPPGGRGGGGAGAGRAAGAASSAAGELRRPLPRSRAAARPTCWPRSSAAASAGRRLAARDRARRSAWRWPRWRRRSTRLPGRPSTSTRTSSWPTCCSASCRCRSVRRDQDRPVDRRRHAGGAGGAAPGAGQDRRVPRRWPS